MAKGKKGTPEHLDKYFARNIISEDQYKFFWPQYWKAKAKSKEAEQRVINKWFPEGKKVERGAVLPTPTPVKVETKIRDSFISVKRDIARIEKQTGEKFHIVRRDRFGRFNSRGRSYQAVRNGGKKK